MADSLRKIRNDAYLDAKEYCLIHDFPPYSLQEVSKEDAQKLDLIERTIKVVNSQYEVTDNSLLICKLAVDVIEGKFGNGETRKKRLGHLYEPVQEAVNIILGY